MCARDAQGGSGRVRGLIINGLLVALAFGLLAWTIRGNWSQIQQVIASRPDLRLFALALVIYVCSLLLSFVRWYFLVKALELPFQLRDAMRLGFIGNVFNLVIPGAVGGDLIKAAFLCREQAKKTQAVASMVVDRGVGLLGLFVLAGVAGLFELSTARTEVRTLIGMAWLAVAAGVIGLAILFTPTLYGPLLRLVTASARLSALGRELVSFASAYRKRIPVVFMAVGMAVLGHTLNVLAFTVVDRALYGASAPSLGRHLVIAPLVLFTMAVPLPFGALGLTEKASEKLFDLVQFPGGAVAMMGFRVVMYAAGLLSAFVYLANARQVRALRERAEVLEHELEQGVLVENEAGEQQPLGL
jgi:uncharacterized membrane protein YbhN (UPF0104 family)